jgi:[phosphatase 2A protein]-leucine-carboxy methyltransferase
VGADLRRIKDIETKFSECNLDYSKPTVFIFECVLVYLPVASSHALLKFIADKFHTAFCVNYEQVCCYVLLFMFLINEKLLMSIKLISSQVNMTDRFGEVMLFNLKGRGCTLAGVEACASLDSQEERYYSSYRSIKVEKYNKAINIQVRSSKLGWSQSMGNDTCLPIPSSQ